MRTAWAWGAEESEHRKFTQAKLKEREMWPKVPLAKTTMNCGFIWKDPGFRKSFAIETMSQRPCWGDMGSQILPNGLKFLN